LRRCANIDGLFAAPHRAGRARRPPGTASRPRPPPRRLRARQVPPPEPAPGRRRPGLPAPLAVPRPPVRREEQPRPPTPRSHRGPQPPAQRGEHRSGAAAAAEPGNQPHRPRRRLIQIAGQGGDAGGIVRAVEQNHGRFAPPFQAPRPAGCEPGAAQGTVGKLPAILAQARCPRQGLGVIIQLVGAGQGTGQPSSATPGARTHMPAWSPPQEKSRPACQSGAPQRAATVAMTSAASADCTPLTTATPGLMIPAFSAAMAASDSPRCSW